MIKFSEHDVVRHEIVMHIIKAYEKFEKKHQHKKRRVREVRIDGA